MATAKGFKGQLRFDVETEFGTTPGTPAAYQMPIISSKINATQALDNDPTLTGRRDPTKPTVGQLEVSGQVVAPVDKVGLGYWLKAICGAPTTTGAGDPYTHVFKPGDTQSSLTLEQAYPDVNVYDLFNGCKVGKFSLQWGGTGVAQITFDVMGAKHTTSGTSFDSSPTAIALSNFLQSEATIEEGGSASAIITQASIDVDLGLDGDYFGNNGQRTDITEGVIACSGSITAYVQNTTLLTKGTASTETSLKFKWTKGAHSFDLFFPEVLLERTSPGIDGPGGVRVTMNWKAFYENSASNAVFVATLINATASYA